MRVIRPFLKNIPVDEEEILLSYENFGALDFASVVKQKARNLKVGARIAEALSTSFNVKDAAAAFGINYAEACRAWNKILYSMKADLADEEIRALVPEDRSIKG